MVWQFIAAVIVTLVLSAATRPKPQSLPPPGFEDVQFPTVGEGQTLPVLYGTDWIKGPNVGWFGDVKFTAIKKKP